MCLYPKIIKNRKYTANKKNGGLIPPVTDERTKYVPVGCGKCMECRKQYGRSWQIRLLEEIKHNKNGKFITLTFSNESIYELCQRKETKNLEGYDLDNQIATTAIRLFLERWRKKYKKSLRHWFVTELGHEGTQNIHLHGLVWTDTDLNVLKAIWQYGYVWTGKGEKQQNYVNEQTVNYIIKYVTKTDEHHKYYKSIILTSPGIGKQYLQTLNATLAKYKGSETKEEYTSPTGHKIAMPTYYRNHIYTDQQKEKLWLQKLDKEERWICGEKLDATNLKAIEKTLNWYRKINKRLGYGNDEKNWEREEYETQQRRLMYEKRMAKIKQEWNDEIQ